MPFTWTLDPGRGCTHGCHSCVARRYQAQLESGTRDHFMNFLAREFPALTTKYEHPCAAKYEPKACLQRVQEMVGMPKARLGVSARRDRSSGGAPRPR